MKSSPILSIIHNPGCKSDCSFGARDRFEQDIRVGTSARNSHTLADIRVERHANEDGSVEFRLFLDGEMVRKGTLVGNTFAHEVFKRKAYRSTRNSYE